jgi:hypothetical protein
MKWARIFIKTVEIFEPESKIYIHGINLHKKNIYELRNFKNIIEINNKKIKLHPSLEGQRAKGGGWMAQIISMRAGMFLEAMEKYPDEDIYVTCDVDMVLLKELNDLRKGMEDKDLGLCVFIAKNKPREEKFTPKVMATFVCAKRTDAAIKYFKRCDELSREIYIRTIDQIALVRAYKELKNELKIHVFDRAYLDPFFLVNSYLWSAHKSMMGSKKNKLKLYKKFVQDIVKHPIKIESIKRGINEDAQLIRRDYVDTKKVNRFQDIT